MDTQDRRVIERIPGHFGRSGALAENALSKGLLQGYRSVESTDTVLRGRLRTDDQLRHRFGIPVPLLLRYDDYLSDIPENQILKAATSRLLLVPALRTSVVARLRGLSLNPPNHCLN